MLVVYTLTIVLSATLLFLVQPMAAKMLLPVLGGSPSVWNTCMVFFQILLLCGYLYAHLLTRWVKPRWQVVVHVAVLALPLLVLPLGAGSRGELAQGSSPVIALLIWLTVWVGPPFFVLATSGPLFQRWFSATDHPDAADPYFLYAASNVGSIAALLAYPLAIEPLLRLAWQSSLWSAGYAALIVFGAACGVMMIRGRALDARPTEVRGSALPDRVSNATRVLWIVLAMVPSSAMLGTTQYLTTGIAAVPLLWVVPLALYLLTFIAAFSRRRLVPVRAWGVALGVCVVAVAAIDFSRAGFSKWALIPLHLLTLFLVGMLCHGRLAKMRPAPARLTEFFLLIAVGGALGGVFNALVAPLIFDSVIEYPIALVAACLLRPSTGVRWAERSTGARLLDVGIPVGLAALIVGLDIGIWPLLASVTDIVPFLRLALPLAICLALLKYRVRFALAAAVLLAAGLYVQQIHNTVLYTTRTFFGVHGVIEIESAPFDARDPAGRITTLTIPFHQLAHGATRHGSQALPAQLRSVPTAYFHRSGPLGQVFDVLRSRPELRVGVIGLGAGTVAAYGVPGMHVTFYEIDQAVVDIASNADYFTYIRDSKARVDFVVGDGRAMLERTAADGEFDLIVADAFSSGAIPVHLMTREAVELYMNKLKPDGILAMNLTSRYFDLFPVMHAIADDLGLAGLSRNDDVTGLDQMVEGKDPSQWAIVVRRAAVPPEIAADPRWHRRADRRPRPAHLWTDDYSNVLGVLESPWSVR